MNDGFRLGFTGTQYGCTYSQKQGLRILLLEHEFLAPLRVKGLPHEAHHGMCVGADAQFHSILLQMLAAGYGIRIHGHPSNIKSKIAACSGLYQEHRKMPPLDRNPIIVKNGKDLMIACPKDATEERRSGTWTTVREARRQARRIVLVLPDGTIIEDKG